MPPDEAGWKRALQALGIQSALFLSIHTEKAIHGMLGFGTMDRRMRWSQNQINGLRIVAQSDGPGLGATFTLEIPYHKGEKL